MSFKKSDYYTLVQQACDRVPDFKMHYQQFQQKSTLNQCSESLVANYGRCIAQVALHFNQVPNFISPEDLNAYLYRLCVHDGKSEGYFKQAVYGLRYWFKMLDLPHMAVHMPPIKNKQTLPRVLSKEECKELFKAPRTLKHRYLLAFAYSAGLRMNEIRLLKISDVNIYRKQIHVRQGKGKKDRYVVLSILIADKLSLYLQKEKPIIYLFEGITPGKPMGPRSIQYVINQALARTSIKKNISMHTLRHSFATHLLEDGIDIYSIQKLLGHSHIQTTITYLHIAQIRPQLAHSPFDTLYHRL